MRRIVLMILITFCFCLLLGLCTHSLWSLPLALGMGLPIGAGGALYDTTLKGLATWDGGNFSSQAVAAAFVMTPLQACNGSQTWLILTAGGVGAGFNVTTPSAQQLVQQFKAAYGVLPAVGSTFSFELINNGVGQTATLVGGTGVTITGTTTVATNTTRLWLVTFTNAGDSNGLGATVTYQNLTSRTN